MKKIRMTTRFQILILIMFAGAVLAQDQLKDLRGPYLGQTPPDKNAVLFAAEIISYDVHDSPTFSLDAKEILIGSMEEGIKYYKMRNGSWSSPEELPFNIPGICNGLVLSPSGKRAYIKIWQSSTNKEDFHVCEKAGNEWTNPRLLEGEVNSYKTHWQFSVANNENLYFPSGDRILVSYFGGDQYHKPVPLKLQDNTDLIGDLPFIAPDESYLIYSIYQAGGGQEGFRPSYQL